MKLFTTIAIMAITLAATISSAAAGQFQTDKFDNFTLHTYTSGDPMADVSFIVESPKKLVIIEPQCFGDNVAEFTKYTKKLGKPIEEVLVSFHAGGLTSYPDTRKVTTKPMASFMGSVPAKGMMAHFDKVFKGAMDTKTVPFDETIPAKTTFKIDGVTYNVEPTAVPGMPGSNIGIEESVYYQHFVPSQTYHASKNLINSVAALDGALADAKKAKERGYKLLIGNHGAGRANQAVLDFQIKYLETMKKLSSQAKTSNEFIAQMEKIYPDLKAKKNLKEIAAALYK